MRLLRVTPGLDFTMGLIYDAVKIPQTHKEHIEAYRVGPQRYLYDLGTILIHFKVLPNEST